MAAQDYYNSFAAPPSGPQATQQRPPQSPHTKPLYPASGYPSQTPPQQFSRPPSQATSQAPPPYSPYQQQHQPVQPPQSAPPQQYQQSQSPFYPPPPNQGHYPPQNGYLAPPSHDANGSPLKPARSYSSPPEERRHRRHHRDSDASSHSDDSRSRSRSGSYSRDRQGYERAAHHRKDKVHHKEMDTFLGAGGGAIIGDAIFPGLGTVGGLLLGGYGGRQYAKKQDARSKRTKELKDDYREERRSRSSAPDYRYERR